ncbi:hypothetical protein A8924_0218 [Saccharopolyspora erythraea NRRL 2338]|uniref:Uncharacterized protein n=2 Tax=Saccharopolyspora erythraea TaxID=1836 RepID=A4FQR6_SACEN|nr:hypothetical protein [Saccharopolyspora erythraea]EQD87721.1 hypothetical protein N599_02870 [Saccharopolyspora erythraea D]PFG92993.1 hypothetical protein A8924_0218 [Saccharopolyspora erythraea NRRL 2338]QRK89883.1 hypothetical protein JQX30_36220 [Saccharopolyspora erythraea]CAM06391.1 hypothetical protein SACE_7233 [Saccharopolyspora erythraea NRRL 2338]
MDLDTADKLASVLSAGLAGISLLLTLGALWITLADRRERRRGDQLIRAWILQNQQVSAFAPELAANPPVEGPTRPWNAGATASAQEQPPDMSASAPANPSQAPSPFVPPRHEWVPSADLRPAPGYGQPPDADPYPAADEDAEQESGWYAEAGEVVGYDQGYAPPVSGEETPPAGQALPPAGPPRSETTQSVPPPPSRPQPAWPAQSRPVPASPRFPWGQPAYGEAPRTPAPAAMRPAPRSRRGAVVAMLAAAATCATLSAVLFVVL